MYTPSLSLRVCGSPHEADSLKYFKGSLFTTEISRRNCSHTYWNIFSRRCTQQSWDSPQLRGAQAFAWTFTSAMWSCSNNKAGSDAPRADECCVGRMCSAELRVFDQCALNPDSICSGVGVDLRDTRTTEHQPLNPRHVSASITGGLDTIHGELLRWKTSSAFVVSEMRGCRAVWIKNPGFFLVFCAWTKECWS